jgi:signal recognition particle GTPase
VVTIDSVYEMKVPPIVNSKSEMWLNRYFNPNYDGIKIINEDCCFVSDIKNQQHCNNIFSEESVIILQAFLGKGKTTAIKRIMPQYKRVLFVSPRRTFSRFLCKDFGASCYLDWTAENNV